MVIRDCKHIIKLQHIYAFKVCESDMIALKNKKCIYA